MRISQVIWGVILFYASLIVFTIRLIFPRYITIRMTQDHVYCYTAALLALSALFLHFSRNDQSLRERLYRVMCISTILFALGVTLFVKGT